MGIWGQGSQWAGYDYAQANEPLNPEEGEMWYDMDDDRALVYTGVEWQPLDIADHGQLAGIVEDAHHNPVSVKGPLRLSSGQVLDVAASDGLDLDADGRLRVAPGSVTESMLAFDAATQAELDGHESDTSNPHNVSDDQTGAADALNSHASDAAAHRSDSDIINTANGEVDADLLRGQAPNDIQHTHYQSAAATGEMSEGDIVVPMMRVSGDTPEFGLYNITTGSVVDAEPAPNDATTDARRFISLSAEYTDISGPRSRVDLWSQ